jgi:acyl carrier protein
MTTSPQDPRATTGEDTVSAEAIADWLTACIADYREMQPSAIDKDAPLADLGLDSVYALTLCGDVEDHWGLETDPTVAWDFPTINALAGHLHDRLKP